MQSLLDEGYTVAGVNTSMAGGGGVYLLKGKVLVYCYVTETPGSASVDTQYCKVVK